MGSFDIFTFEAQLLAMKDIETLLLCLTGLWWENTGDNQWRFQLRVYWFTIQFKWNVMMPCIFKCGFQDPSAVGIKAWVGRQTSVSQSALHSIVSTTISININCQSCQTTLCQSILQLNSRMLWWSVCLIVAGTHHLNVIYLLQLEGKGWGIAEGVSVYVLLASHGHY